MLYLLILTIIIPHITIIIIGSIIRYLSIWNTNITINANTTNNATGVLSSQDAYNAYSEDNFAKLAKQLMTVIGA